MTDPTLSLASFYTICDQLAAADAQLLGVIQFYGYPHMWSRPNTFETLVHIILEQQVSLASALAALNQLRQKIKVVTPEEVLLLTDEELRACYFSRQKSACVRHLAQTIVSGDTDLNVLGELPDEDVRARLRKLKGIGDWTIDIYLIFALQRMDIFPIGDLAAVSALRTLKAIPKDAPRDRLIRTAEQWKPYRTVATMLLWHYYLSLRLHKTVRPQPNS